MQKKMTKIFEGSLTRLYAEIFSFFSFRLQDSKPCLLQLYSQLKRPFSISATLTQTEADMIYRLSRQLVERAGEGYIYLREARNHQSLCI